MELSIIIPVYNSSKILKKLILAIFVQIKKNLNLQNFEIFLINDCSQDNSWQVIYELSRKYKNIKGINLKRNFGQHNAILSGLKYCRGEKIIIMDDDFEHPPVYLKKFFYELDDYEVCYTYYLNRKHSFIKKIFSQINNLISSFLLKKPINIYLSSYKAFNKKIKKNIINQSKNYIYLDYLIISNAKKIKMISIQHGKRMSGKSNYSFIKLFKLWSTMILSIDIQINTFRGLIIYFFKNILLIFLKKEKKPYVIKETTFLLNKS